jgi:PilZ domain
MNYPQQRRYPRCPVEAPLRAWSIASGAGHASRGQCVNLSEAGAGAIISGPWMPGQVVTIELSVPGTSLDITVQARVRYRDHTYCGFEFLGADENIVQQLRTVCSHAA